MRVVTIWAMIGIVALGIAGILLIPPYISITTQIKAYQTGALEAAEKIASYQSSSVALITASKQASWVLEVDQQVRLSAIVGTLEAAVPSTITLSSISLSRTATDTLLVSISGVADTRSDLVALQTTLQALPEITTVDFPVTNLTRSREVLFTLVFSWQSIP